MLNCTTFYRSLEQAGVHFFTGVPDSLLKPICACITERSAPDQHVIAANEGAAVALATGSYLATGNPALVYMQNSGLGNAVNPLLSLTDPQVYAIPMLMMIGWRGEPGVPDEPQHLKQGEVTTSILDTLGIPYAILPDNDDEAHRLVQSMFDRAKQQQQPVALIVRKNTFNPYPAPNNATSDSSLSLTRERAIEIILDEISEEDVVVATTGMISREIYEFRENNGQGHDLDFLTVGSMGHSSQIALGLAQSTQDKTVYCIDGDGSVIMHMGSLGIMGQSRAGNLNHIVLNNGKHDSVGGQPTIGFQIDLPAIAQACGYRQSVCVDTEQSLRKALRQSFSSPPFDGPTFLEVQVLPGSRSDLGRPTTTPVENKEIFMAKLRRP